MASSTKWPASYANEIPQDQLPIAHRTSTIHGLVVTFQVLAWLTVGFRMYCRSIVAHSFGWDDFFVLCSLAVTTVSTALVAVGTKYGIGQHYAYVTNSNYLLIGWSKVYFFSTVFYFLSATLIKISILFQYLRLFRNAKSRMPRRVVILVAVITTIWGGIYFFVQLFSCSPVSDAWSLSLTPNCRLLMSPSLNLWLRWIYTHATTNMLLDYLILLLPMCFRRHLEVEARGRKALIALFSIGGCVATISAIRFALLVKYKGGLHPIEDATWHAPAILIPSALEIQAAVICASIPIFWPIIAQVYLDQIRVTREVTLHSEARAVAPGLQGWKRHLESSETELRDLNKESYGRPEKSDAALYSKDPYITGWQVTNDGLLDSDVGNKTTVENLYGHTHKKRISGEE